VAELEDAAGLGPAGPQGPWRFESSRPHLAREGTIRTPDGRTVAYAEHGDGDAHVVFYQHGTPGGRKDRHPDEAVYDGIRVVAHDRPGYGGSEPRPGRRVVDVAADVEALADRLGVERFAVMGVSGGGPHALACAALLPGRVTRAAIVVGAAPADDPAFDFLAGMGEVNLREFGAARAGEEALAAELAPFVAGIREDAGAVVDGLAAELPPYDQEVARRPEMRAVLVESFVEAARQGARGWMDDDLAFVRAWGFALSDVRAPVRLWQGELDVLVPRSHGEYLAANLPDARFELVPGAGHLIVDEWPRVLAWLVEEGAPAP
jgi:pimeloyl-ACP methyl ester carboxylesterase